MFFSSFADRPATTSLPFEESGSLRDRTELATAIHAPRETARKGGERNIYVYVYILTYIYIYKEKSKGNTREWKLRTAMSISHQACCCSSFNIITRRGKRKRGLDIHIYVVRNLIVIVLHTFPHLSMMMIDPQGCPFFDACSFHLYPSVPSSRIRGNQFRDVTIFYYYYYY